MCLVLFYSFLGPFGCVTIGIVQLIHDFCYLLDSFHAEEFVVLFGIFTAYVNLSRAGLLRGLDRLAGNWLLSELVWLDDMLAMIWCDQCKEVV